MDGCIDRRIRMVLSGDTIYLDKLNDETGIFDRVDTFVNLSRDNETVTQVFWGPATDPSAHSYAIWDIIAERIGNLRALNTITITHYNSDNEEDIFVPNWEILACILRRLRRGIQLCMCDDASLLWNTAALPAFAEEIHRHAMITGFSTGDAFLFDCLDVLGSALLTLPALENVSFEHDDGEGPEEDQSLESMVKLLLSPTLRKGEFESVVFTNTRPQAVAKEGIVRKDGNHRVTFLSRLLPQGRRCRDCRCARDKYNIEVSRS